MVGEFPGLAVARRGRQPPHTSDFRGVYCALLEQWLGVDAAPIIPNASTSPPGAGGLMRRWPSLALALAVRTHAPWPRTAAERASARRSGRDVHRARAGAGLGCRRAAPSAVGAAGRRPGPAPGPPGRRRDARAPASCPSAAKEFSLTLSRPLVGAGRVRVELRNIGEDPHNLVVSPEGTPHAAGVLLELDPGGYERRSVSLSPGRYQLWCSLAGHERRHGRHAARAVARRR